MSRSSFSKYAIIAALVSGICGFFHSLPLLHGLPTHAGLAAAARGIASLQGLQGYGTASWIDQIAGRLWQSGGASRLAAGQWLALFAGWTLASFLALVVLFGFLRRLSDARTRRIAFGSTIILVLATCVTPVWETLARRKERVSDLGLMIPVELVNQFRALNDAKTFANPSALASLLLLAPNSAGSVSMADSGRLSMSPERWREGLRQAKWSVVLLSGPLGEYRPLLEHLMASPDWHLGSVSNHGFLFLYGFGLQAHSLDETFRLATDHDTAVYLAQISGNYEAISRTRDARACLERALALAPDNATVLLRAANFAAARKRWQDAIDYSSRALMREPDLAQAKVVQALAFLETGEADRAQQLVDQILLQFPNDPYTLFLSARICRALKDYVSEAETLEKLIALGQKAGASTANYRIYLGQAYAKQSLVEPALQNYRTALNSGQLDAKEAEEVQQAMESIESRRTP
jgi:Tfp pilus assembly protein PilF